MAQVSEPRIPSLCSGPPDEESLGVGGYEEGGDALFAERRVGDGEHHRDFGAFAVGDELLRAVQHPVALGQHRAGLQIMGFRAGLRFGQAEATDGLAERHVGQIAPLLRIGAEGEDGRTADGAVDAHQRRGGGAARRYLLHRECIADIIGVGAAPFFRHHHAHQTQLAQLDDRIVGNPRVLVEGGGAGRQFQTREFTRRIADHALLFGVEIGRHVLVPPVPVSRKL